MKRYRFKSLQAELLCAYMDVKDKVIPIYDTKADKFIAIAPERKTNLGARTPKKITIEELADQVATNPSSVQKWRIGERPIPPDLVGKVEKILHIPNGQLEQYGNIDSATLKVIQALRSLDTLSLFVVNRNYSAYLGIGEVAWRFICIYLSLNTQNRKKLHRMTYRLQTNIDMQLNCVKKVAPYFELRDTSVEQYEELLGQRDLDDPEQQIKLRNQIVAKIKKASLRDCELLLSQIGNKITTMDTNTWNMLIAFMLLGQLIHYSSEQQQKLIETATLLRRMENVDRRYAFFKKKHMDSQKVIDTKDKPNLTKQDDKI